MDNANLAIENRLSALKLDRDRSQVEIEKLLYEKTLIEQTIPKLLYKLNEMKKEIIYKKNELTIYDNAIAGIANKYDAEYSNGQYILEDNELVSYPKY